MKFQNLLLVLFSVVGLAGCASKPPSCIEPSTLELIKQIFFENVDKSIVALGGNSQNIMPLIKSNVDVSVSNIRSEGYDEAAKKHMCASEIVITIKPTKQSDEALKKLRVAQNAGLSPNSGISMEWQQYGLQAIALQLGLREIPDLTGVEIGNSKLSGSVTYTSTLAEDPKEGKRQYVEVVGIIPFVNSVIALTTAGGFKKEVAAAQAPQQAEPVQQTENVGQCVYPKTTTAQDGSLKFANPISIWQSPSESTNHHNLTEFTSFTIGAEAPGGFIQLVATPGDEGQNPDAGKAIGWAKLADFEFQELRNCN